MRTTIVIDQDKKQIVLTPENKQDEQVVKMLFGERNFAGGSIGEPDKVLKVDIFRGEFYECQGGWLREGSSKDSVIMVLKEYEQD